MASKDDLNVRKYQLISTMRAFSTVSFCLGLFTLSAYAAIFPSWLPFIGMLVLLLSACLAIPEMNAFKRRLDAPTGNSDAQPNASKAAETLQVAATGGKLVHALADFVSTAALAAVLFFTFRDLSHLQCNLPTENLPVPGKVMCNSGRVVWGTYCTLPIIFSLFCNLILIFSVHLVVLKQRIVDIRRCPDCKVRTQEQATEEERVELVERVDLEQQTGLLQEENTNLHTPEK